jgi:KDO2-lipid IV(A) lauroyltransferase
MSRQRSACSDYAVYLVLRFLVCIIQALPTGARDALVNGLAWLTHRIDRRHREVARDNLRHAFGARDDDDRLVVEVYRHFCRLLVEIVILPRKLHFTNWRRHLELTDGKVLVDRLLSDRPLMIVTGHLGNGEMAGYALGLFGFHTYAIARPIDNPYLDAYLRKFREATGQTVLAKQGDFERMQEILAAGGVLATLADQDAGPRGQFVEFFGRPASTHKAIALLSVEFNVPLLVVGVLKVGEPMRYRIAVRDLILPEDYAGRPDALRAITQRFTTALEELVREAPAQYLWLHRRWKHQPKARAKRAA